SRTSKKGERCRIEGRPVGGRSVRRRRSTSHPTVPTTAESVASPCASRFASGAVRRRPTVGSRRRVVMRIPVIRGVIDRRILVNYRIAPAALARVLPPPFRPKLIHGTGMAGVCLIRLKHVRPRLLPPWLGIASENAAHRIAVEWDDGGERREGVYIPRRD